MEKTPSNNKKFLRDLNAQIKVLQTKLAEANKKEGKDAYIEVKINKNQGRFERIKQKGKEDKEEARFYLELDITAKESDVYIPLSIASGKKVAGFMYQIEGTGEGGLLNAGVEVRGEGVTMVTVGTIVYAKVPLKKTGSFEIRAAIKGQRGKSYAIVFSRLNYKLSVADIRYEQYLKEIRSGKVVFK